MMNDEFVIADLFSTEKIWQNGYVRFALKHVRVDPVKQKILPFLRFLRALNRLAKIDLCEQRKILKSILRFLCEVTRLGKNLRAPEQILRTHFAKGRSSQKKSYVSYVSDARKIFT